MIYKTNFIPIDYDYFDWQGRNYARIIGRDKDGKRISIIDSCPVYLWAILKDNLKETQIKKLIVKISKIKLDVKGRKTRVEKVELHNKKFLEKPVKALKIFATNYKDLHDITDNLDFDEIDKRRGYDLGYITHYIIEKKLKPLCEYNIEGELLNNSEEFGNIDMALEVDKVVDITHGKIKELEKTKPGDSFTPRALAYDIECDELQIGKGEILMVSLVSSSGFKKVLTWKTLKKGKKPAYVEYVKDEAELLEKFVQEVKTQDPDFLVGYFSDGFDLPYLKARAEKHNVKLSLGLDGTQPRFSRGAMLTGKISGIVHIDLLKFIRTAYAQYMKSETLSLNEVAKEFLGDTKKDFKIKHSSKLEHKDFLDYYEYNLHDSVLTLQLFEKFWPDMLEFTKIVQEPIFEISRAGLSKFTESYILHNLEKFNEIPEKRPSYDSIGERKNMRVEGAFVLEPTPGLYENIAMFDFTSMHTSIIISHNISKATLLEKKQPNSYESPEIEEKGKTEKYYFSKKPGFFPELMKEIFQKRKQFKQEYKKNPNSITLARSNAFKVLSASAHGYIAFFGARYYSHEASASILAFVRKYNKETIKKVEQAGFKVIFGDSVDGKTKVIVKNKEKVYEEDIENLFKKKDQKDAYGKEYDFKKNLQVLTLNEKGISTFKPIVYVMRHKCNKKMYKVNFTNNWSIDVTEDHSLIGYQSEKFNQCKTNKKNPLLRLIEISPTEIKKKTSTIATLKKIPLNPKTKNYPKEIYEFLGFFIGDGSFARSKEHIKSDKDYMVKLSLGLDKDELLKNLITPLMELGYIKNFWESKTRKGDLTINGLKLMDIISNNVRSKEGKKIIPEWLFEEKEENICSFLRGLFSADGTVILRGGTPIIRYTSINDEYIQQVRKLLYRVGISHSTFKENSPNKYKTKIKTYSTGSYSKNILVKNKEVFAKKIGFILERKNKRANIETRGTQKKLIEKFDFDTQSVKEVKEIKSQKYVYDIEVKDTHRFFANNVLVHNTDSVAFLMGNQSENQIKEFLKKLNSELPGVMELELENFFKRGLWVTTRGGVTGAKKKYALLDKKGKIKIRGFETVRRDWCKLARNVQNKVLNQILKDGNEKKAIEFVKELIKNIKARKILKEDLMIRTQLKKPISEYKAISPHVIAARKMKEQKIPIEMGGLIEYYVAENKNGKKNQLVRDRVKLPEEPGEYDIGYYLRNQILPAVENIFQVFKININEIIEGKKQTTLGDF